MKKTNKTLYRFEVGQGHGYELLNVHVISWVQFQVARCSVRGQV